VEEPYTETAPGSEQRAALAMALRELCERAHGRLRVLLGPDSVAAWIEDVRSPAERAVAQGLDGHRLLQCYVGQLLATVMPDLQAHVEGITGRRIVSSNSHADMKTGHMLCFFVLGEPLTDVAAVAVQETGLRS